MTKERMIQLASIESKNENSMNIISENEIEFETMRSGGSGGQSVNTTDSAVRGTWNIDKYFSGTEEEKVRVIEYIEKNNPKHLKRGEHGELLLVAKSQTQKSQLQNKANALERMNELMTLAMEVREERIEIMPRNVKAKSDRRRLDDKSMAAKLKRSRAYKEAM